MPERVASRAEHSRGTWNPQVDKESQFTQKEDTGQVSKRRCLPKAIQLGKF